MENKETVKLSIFEIKEKLMEMVELEELEKISEIKKLQPQTDFTSRDLKSQLKKIIDKINKEKKEKEKKEKEKEKKEKEKDKKDKIETDKNQKEIDKTIIEVKKINRIAKDNKVAKQILEKLMRDDFNGATELMVDHIKQTEHISTLMHDTKPEMWVYKNGLFEPQGKSLIIQRIRQVVGEVFDDKFSNNVIKKIQADSFTKEEDFFKEEPCNLILLKNGIFNTETKELINFSPNYRFFTRVPVDYVPEQKCEKIIEFLESIFKNKEDILIIQELVGFLLIRDYFIEVAFMFNGSGRNGKSKLMDLLKRFIGAENCCDIALQDMERDQYSISELHKKLMNISGDLSSQALSHTGNFKKATGRDLLSAPRKYLTRINFLNYSKFIFASNELPITKDLTPAFFLRWILLDFPFTFLPQSEIDKLPVEDRKNVKLQNPHIIDSITSDKELSGFLNWGLEGLERLKKNKKFSYSLKTSDVRKTWLRKSSSFEAFFMDKIQEKYGCFLPKSVIQDKYAEYCKQYKVKMLSPKMVKVLLEERGVIDDKMYMDNPGTFKKEQVRGWSGITWQDK